MRIIILALSICGMVVSLQQTMMVPLLTDLDELLGTTPENVSWVITVTLLTSAVTMPILSRLADMFGKRRMMLVCLVLVTVGSLIGAFSDSLISVVIARGIQGMSFAIVPIGISVMRDLLPRHQLGTAVALMSATLGIGGAIGLPFGGFVYSTWGLPGVFIVSAVVGVLLLVMLPMVVAESAVRAPGRIDYLGSLVLSAALVCLLLPVTKGSTWGWTNPLVLGLLGAFLVLITLWIPLELRIRSPLVDLRTMARRPVMLTNMTTVLMGFAMFGQLLGATQLLTLPEETGAGFGFTPMAAGIFLLPAGLMMVFLAPVSAGLTNRFGARTTLIVGGTVIVSGYIVMAGLHNLGALMVGNILVCSGVAFAYAAMPTLIMSAVPVTETASANGLNALLRSVGTATCSAVVAMVLAADVIEFRGVPVPTFHAFQIVFWISAAAAGLGTLIAWAIPKDQVEPDRAGSGGAPIGRVADDDAEQPGPVVRDGEAGRQVSPPAPQTVVSST